MKSGIPSMPGSSSSPPSSGKKKQGDDEAALDSIAMTTQILEQLARAQEPMGVTQLANILDTSKPRISRYLSSLKNLGLAEQDPATERYWLGWKLLMLGEAAARQFDVRRIAQPYLRALRDSTGLTALLSIPIAGRAVVVATAESAADVSITVRPGNRPAAHCSAQGRIVLAYSSKAVVEAVLAGPLEARTPESLTDPRELVDRMALIRERLYDTAPGEARSGVNTLAAPLLGGEGDLKGAIGIIGSMEDIANPPSNHHLEYVQGAAAAISGALRDTSYASRGIPPMELVSPR